MTRVFLRIFAAFSFLSLLGFPLQTVQAATITVTETTDAFSGSVCTLRNAIQSVNNGADFGGCDFDETIPFGPDDTINLTATQPYVLSLGTTGAEDNNAVGDLDISASVRIIGLGAAQTTISGSGFPQGEEDRVIHIIEEEIIPEGIEPSIEVLLQGMTIRDGNSTNTGDGGGVACAFLDARVTLDDVIVTANQSGSDGGGIFNNDESFFIILNSRINGNQAEPSNEGGGITNESFMVIRNSTLDGNSANDGGAIENESQGQLLIENSTISRNTAVGVEEEVSGSGLPNDGAGGGIINSGVLLMINSTISNNEAAVNGGGISSQNNIPAGEDGEAFLALFNVTVAENEVLAVDGIGGGICFACVVGPGGTTIDFNVANTLIAQNTAANSPDCGGDFVSGGYNLLGDGTGCNGFTATGDQVGVAGPGIGPLQNNGGPTETHALLEGSQAIDRANDVDGCQAPDVDQVLNLGGITFVTLDEDQRAFTRPIAVLDPSVPICDIGAFEFQVATPTPTPTALPTPTPSPTPLANAFLFGGACSLHTVGGSSAGIGLMAFGLLAGMIGWRKRRGSSN